MSTILEEICNRKRHDLITAKEKLTPRDLFREVDELMENGGGVHYSFKDSLRQSKTGIIAEFKRKSPSLGWIKEELEPKDVIPGYQENGATAISILTDEPYFGGRLEYIQQMRPDIHIPILRKEFIVDEYQIFEAKKVSADAILLIAACLTKDECRLFATRGKELDMDVLLEVHEEKELEYLCDGVTVAGVNNRNLHLFQTDIQTSFQLAHLIPDEYVKISESGLKNVEDLRLLRQVGYQGFLMGERFMKQDNPAQALGEFIQQL